MLMFDELSKGQKRFVVTFMQYYPTIKKDNRITLQKLNYVLKEIADMRNTGAPVIGYPNWLFKSNKVGRGLYEVPLPTDEELSEYGSAKIKGIKAISVKEDTTIVDDKRSFQKILDEIYTEEEFYAECRAAGIKV